MVDKARDEGLVLAGLDASGREGVGPHAFMGPVGGEVSREADKAGLQGRVGDGLYRLFFAWKALLLINPLVGAITEGPSDI